MRFKIDWSSLINGRRFTVFALFYFVFEGPPGGLYLEGRLNGGCFALPVFFFLFFEGGGGGWGAIFGGAYTWKGLFSEFYGSTMIPERADQI